MWGNKELFSVSFKKNFNKDISLTISCWKKQTLIVCYRTSYLKALSVDQVRVQDVRAFAASKAFCGGISLEQMP